MVYTFYVILAALSLSVASTLAAPTTWTSNTLGVREEVSTGGNEIASSSTPDRKGHSKVKKAYEALKKHQLKDARQRWKVKVAGVGWKWPMLSTGKRAPSAV